MSNYDREMDLAYGDDAATFDVEITVIDPETGESETAMVDNLTNAMYWIVAHNLLPLREGFRTRVQTVHGQVELSPEAAQTFQEAVEEVGTTQDEVFAAWREQNLHPIMLTITCEGDPELLRAGL